MFNFKIQFVLCLVSPSIRDFTKIQRKKNMEDLSVADFSYKNLISNFFFDDKLIPQRNQRIDKCVQFVIDNVPVRDLSKKLQDVIKNKVSSIEITFAKKWRESKSKSKDEFEQTYEKWIHTDLQVIE